MTFTTKRCQAPKVGKCLELDNRVVEVVAVWSTMDATGLACDFVEEHEVGVH